MACEYSSDCFSVAFYGITIDGKSIEHFYRALLRFFDSLDCPPDRLSISRNGNVGKVGAFSAENAKLRTSGFDDVDGVSLYSLIPKGEIPVSDWRVSAELFDRCCFVGARCSLLANLSDASFKSIAQEAINCFEPNYGIGFRRDIRSGPGSYAIGLYQGTELWGLECSEISAWGEIALEHEVYRVGILRDVYPWNFLTDSQLSKLVDSVSLERWIAEDARRGKLSTCVGGTLWELTDLQIKHVQPLLKQAGVVFEAGQE